MTFRDGRRVIAAAALAATLAVGLQGCGEKIAIPEAEGLFGNLAYSALDSFPGVGARQLCIANNSLFVVSDDNSLTKRNQSYAEFERVDGLEDPTAVCTDEEDDIIFVWEQGTRVLSAWASSDLTPLGASELPDVQSGSRLLACATGVEGAADGARTFIYVTDPDSLVVHRYAWYEGGTAVPMGILCRSDGLGTRFVHEPEGMVVDAVGNLFVCDADVDRNWVIRFDPTPDQTDVTPAPDDSDPWRGTAILLGPQVCNPPAAAEYVIGDAPVCDQTDWVGGPSDEPGAFHAPRALASDGDGRIYVADSGNGRIQIFDRFGVFDQQFTDEDVPFTPVSLGTVDKLNGSSDWFFGAYVYVVDGHTGAVRRFISGEFLNDEDLPPPDQP